MHGEIGDGAIQALRIWTDQVTADQLRATDSPRLKRKIDTDQGRYHYSRRLGTVEPVFGNIRHTHRLNRFSLRGRKKVNAQWILFCLVHNIGKVQRYGLHVMTKKHRRRKAV